MEMTQALIVGSEVETTTAIAVAEPSQELCQMAQLSPFSLDQVAAMVKRREALPADELASYTRTFIHHHKNGLYKVSPSLLKEVKRRFTILNRKMKVDGTYREIDGARSYNAWLELHKIPKRTAYRILAGGDPEKESGGRGAPWSTKTADGTTVLEAFSTIQKDIRRSKKPEDKFEREAIYFTKQLYAIHWEIWKRLLIVASEDIGLADLSVSREVAHLWEVAKTVKDAKHSDLLMLVEAVAICCRAKKSRAMDNAINYEQTWTRMADEEVKKAIDDTTPHTVPEYADDDVHGVHNGGSKIDFLINEDAALGNRSDIAEIIPAEYKRGYHDGFAAGVASVTPPIKPKPTKRKSKKA
jgi:MgsA AAA+ ATPase C terminal